MPRHYFGRFRKLKAGIKNEETGIEGIEPIVRGSHGLKQENWKRVEKKDMAHRGRDVNGPIWSELLIGRGIAAAAAGEKPRKTSWSQRHS